MGLSYENLKLLVNNNKINFKFQMEFELLSTTSQPIIQNLLKLLIITTLIKL